MEIEVLEEECDGWFRGRIASEGTVGWLPLCFTAPASSASTPTTTPAPAPQRHADTMGFSTALLTSGDSAVLACATVVYSFNATQQGQLTLRVGDVLWILEKTNDNWWLARNFRGAVGYVPKLYIKGALAPIRRDCLTAHRGDGGSGRGEHIAGGDHVVEWRITGRRLK